MKPLNLIALLLFLGGAVWAFTRSERAVREIQNLYFSAMAPFLKSGSQLERVFHCAEVVYVRGLFSESSTI